ncbi:hypothetical protein GC175_04040 [bacterium]|nr:hypothetical protein [bacterium]
MDELTQREVDVLCCLAQGLTTPETALALGIGRRTVQGHCEEIYSKLGVGNRIEAVILALDVFISLADAKAAVERRRAG